jgi:outer membrane receptor protein involved in Fe transport
MKPANLLQPLTLSVGLLLAAIPLAAQTAPTPPAAPPEGGNAEVITLNTFDVSASNTHSYTADQTTTGTRVASNLRELPFSVSVITSDFINDFAAFNFNDQVANVSSLSISEVEGTYQLRGFAITTQLVDGFRRVGLIDRVNIDRIDVIKGNSASVYGYIQPGGVVNITTKRPLANPEQGLTVSGGNQDFFRAEAYSTGPMSATNNNWFYRVDMADQHQTYQQEFKATERYYGAFQVLYKPNSDTSLNIKVDNTFEDQNRGAQLLWLKLPSTLPNGQTSPGAVPTPQRPGQFTNNYYMGLAYANNPYSPVIYNFNSSGPEDNNDRRLSSATVSFEHRINDVFSIRNGSNLFVRDFHRTWVSDYEYYVYYNDVGNNSTTNPQQPEYDNDPSRNIANQTDLTAKFDTGPVSHQMLLTADFSSEVDRTQNLRMDPNNASSQPISQINLNGITNLSQLSPNSWNFTTFQQNPSLYDQVQENYWDGIHDYGLFLNEHASMFNKRLNLIAGLRFDWIDTKVQDYDVLNYAAGTLHEQDAVNSTNGYPSHQLGISYRVIKPVTLYVNQSSSISPQANYDPAIATILPSSTSTGYEGGMKVALFKNKLSFTATYYSINQYNTLYETTTDLILASGLSETGIDDYIDIVKAHSTGTEFDLNWTPTKSLQFVGSYSYDDASIRQADPEHIFLDGTPIRRVPANQVGAIVRYEFKDGALKGLFLVGKENFYGRSQVDTGGGSIASSGSGYVNTQLPNGQYPWAPFGIAPNAPVPSSLVTRQSVLNPTGSTPDPLIVRLPDGRQQINNAAYALTSVGIGYSFKTGKYTHKLQLNVNNLLNKAYTYGSAILGDPITYVGSYTLTF